MFPLKSESEFHIVEPSGNPQEDLRTLRSEEWECEECGDLLKDATEVLTHVRNEHPARHVSKLSVRHNKSRRVFPLVMLYRYVVTCGLPGCQVFAARECLRSNAVLDIKHHWAHQHSELKREELCMDEVVWSAEEAKKGCVVRSILKSKRMKPKTIRRKNSRVVTKKKRGSNYTSEEIRNGTQLMFSSLRTYKLLRKLYPEARFPSISTNRSHIKQFKCRWGIQDEMFLLFSLKLSTLNQEDKNVSLAFDEMDLLPKTVYSDRYKERLPKAKKAMCVMARGLGKGFKELIYYDFDTPMEMELLNVLIIRSEEAGAHVRSLVLDMGNQKLLSQLGVYDLQTTFPHPTRPSEVIVIIPDTPHGLKNLRTNLFKHGVDFKYNNETYHFEKQDFVSLFEEDSKLGELRMCPKIRYIYE